MSKNLYRVTISLTLYVVEESPEEAEEEVLSITSIGDEVLTTTNVHAQSFSDQNLLRQLELDGWSSFYPYGKNLDDLTCEEFVLRQIKGKKAD